MSAPSADLSLAIPDHIGIILDGNRRWAKAHGLPSFEGHRRGYDNLKGIARHAFERGITHLTAYIFSTENWKRSKDEVNYLMNLTKRLVEKDGQDLAKEGIRILFMGSREGVRPDILESIDSLESQTIDNHKGTLALCFNYGGQQEIADAVKSIVSADIDIADITTQTVADHVYAATDVPPLDLIIRTSGEQRLSNFMLWRSAYAELYFTDKFWPEFQNTDLDDVITLFANRQRRFGS